MDDAELRNQLRAILDLEAADPVNWTLVYQRSADVLQSMSQSSNYEPPHLVRHFLDDADIREKDSEYAEDQRASIRRFVETGDREPLESEAASAWPYLVVVGLVTAMVAWLLF
jgi:hypothetical protein